MVKTAAGAQDQPTNAFATKALERLHQIEQEATEKKQQELKNLRTALATIDQRIDELTEQKELIANAIGQISGRKEAKRTGGTRTDYSDFRPRLKRWMEGHKGEKFTSTDLAREFPELAGKQVSIVIKPLLDDGSIKKHGERSNTVYYVD